MQIIFSHNSTLYSKLHRLFQHMASRIKILSTLIFFLTVLLSSCSHSDQNADKERPIVILKNNKPRKKSDSTSSSAPIINISDSVAVPFQIIYIKDSAKNNIRLSQKLAKIYAEKLSDCILKNKLKSMGAPVAWYKTQKAPFFFEAGIPVDRKPNKLPRGINYKRVSSGNVMIAHFYGPYEETVQAYQLLKEIIKDRKKTMAGAPYEIYIDDPIGKDGVVKDPYKVQTNIVFPYH